MILVKLQNLLSSVSSFPQIWKWASVVWVFIFLEWFISDNVSRVNVCKFLFHVFWSSLIRHKQLRLLCLPNELHCYHNEVLLFSSSNHICFAISFPWYQYCYFGFLIFIAYFLSSLFNFCPFLILCLHFCCFHLTSLQICLPHSIFSFVVFAHYLLLWVSCLSSLIYSTNNITIAIDAIATTTTYLALLIPLYSTYYVPSSVPSAWHVLINLICWVLATSPTVCLWV